MTGLSQSEQSRGELFRPNERSFTVLHHPDFASASSYCKINLLSHKCAIRYLLDCNKNQARPPLSCNQSIKGIFHQLHRLILFNIMYQFTHNEVAKQK